jgi:hypothetical protein
MNEIYSEIFAGAGDPAEVRRAIARAVRVLREAMAQEDHSAVTAAHVRNLADIAPAALARGYALAEQTCTFWPTPGQIRELAGWSAESQAGAALQWVLAYLRAHGVEGRDGGGGVHFGDDGTGRRVLLRTDPVVAAPAFPAVIAETLAMLGSGTVLHGLRTVSQHPAVQGWDEFSGDGASRAAERIEARWSRCYLQASRQQLHQVSPEWRSE